MNIDYIPHQNLEDPSNIIEDSKKVANTMLHNNTNDFTDIKQQIMDQNEYINDLKNEIDLNDVNNNIDSSNINNTENLKLTIYQKLSLTSNELLTAREKIKFLTQENFSLKNIIANKDKIISDFEQLLLQFKDKFQKLELININLKQQLNSKNAGGQKNSNDNISSYNFNYKDNINKDVIDYKDNNDFKYNNNNNNKNINNDDYNNNSNININKNNIDDYNINNNNNIDDYNNNSNNNIYSNKKNINEYQYNNDYIKKKISIEDYKSSNINDYQYDNDYIINKNIITDDYKNNNNINNQQYSYDDNNNRNINYNLQMKNNELIYTISNIKKDLDLIENDYQMQLREKDCYIEQLNCELINVYKEYVKLSDILEELNYLVKNSNYNELKTEFNCLLREKELLLKEKEKDHMEILSLREKFMQKPYDCRDMDKGEDNKQYNELMNIFSLKENNYKSEIDNLKKNLIEKINEIEELKKRQESIIHEYELKIENMMKNGYQ